MNTQHKLHDVVLKPAFFENRNHATLLRYLDAEFINRFHQDVQSGRFSQTQFGAWLEEERHSEHDDKPVLRLPTHRAFHLVCCEVSCHQLGQPALDPQKIASAGFVIRREYLKTSTVKNTQKNTQKTISRSAEFSGLEKSVSAEKMTTRVQDAWILEDGEAIGWQQRTAVLADPDINRRVCPNGIIHPAKNQAAYSGEEVYPLHPLTVKDSKGKSHTLLFGYVPLGGFYYQRDPNLDEDHGQEIDELAASSLPWPFGFRNIAQDIRANIEWVPDDSLQVNRGRPTKAFTELLMQLVNRYHLGEAGLSDNELLEDSCNALEFHDPELLLGYYIVSALSATSVPPESELTLSASQGLTLGQYLCDCFARGADNPLLNWIETISELADNAGGFENLTSFPQLPHAYADDTLDVSLSVSSSEAETLRQRLGQRLRSLTLSTAREFPVPKFSQTRQDTYRILPFVRSLTSQGKEQITWAKTDAQSDLFRVAATFDPEASRPSLIPMPSLRDLKRGLAKGASMMTPGDTFSLVNALKLKKGVSKETVDISGDFTAGVQWICSFSLPVITIVAMILLMIMVSLLNIIFYWMPWVRICLPFPKMPKG